MVVWKEYRWSQNDLVSNPFHPLTSSEVVSKPLNLFDLGFFFVCLSIVLRIK